MADRDLSITALYTAQTWLWGELPAAPLFATREGERVFAATNAALAIARVFDRRHGSLRHALLHRHAMIDHLLRASACHAVLELAAGLSRRGAASTVDPAMRYVELDRPHVIAHKRRLLERTPAGRAVLARAGYVLVGGDALATPLAALVPAGAPVFVIAEGLTMYLTGAERRRLFAQVGALAARGDVAFVFDLTPASEEPPAGAVGRVLEAAMKRFTGGRAFERDARTRADVLGELAAAGFATAEAIAARDVARTWRLPHADTATPTVVFSARAPATRS